MTERKIEVTKRTSTSFTFKVTGLDPTYTANDRQYVIYIDDVQDSDRLDLAGGVTETPEYTKTGLTPNTVYSIKVNISYSGGWVSVTHDTKTLQEGEEPTPSGKITPWSWYESNKDATAEETQKAYQALINKGSIGDFSYKVWNDLCWKGREIATDDYFDSSWINWANITFFQDNLLIKASNKKLYASRFNDLAKALGKIDIDIPTVEKGDLIYAQYFLDIASGLNTQIAIINKRS